MKNAIWIIIVFIAIEIVIMGIEVFKAADETELYLKSISEISPDENSEKGPEISVDEQKLRDLITMEAPSDAPIRKVYKTDNGYVFEFVEDDTVDWKGRKYKYERILGTNVRFYIRSKTNDEIFVEYYV